MPLGKQVRGSPISHLPKNREMEKRAEKVHIRLKKDEKKVVRERDPAFFELLEGGRSSPTKNKKGYIK